MRASSVWRKNLHSGVLIKAPRACEKFFRTFYFFIEIFEKNMYFTRFCMISQRCIFHEKIITFSFVTLSHMIGFILNFYRRRKIQLPYGICALKFQITPFPRIFVLKTWNFHCTRTSKNWKIHDFFWVFSYVLILFSKSKIVRRTRFCGF